MIYFDLDGVLRDLCGTIGIEPKSYYEQVCPDNQTVMEYLKNNEWILNEARPTEYLEVFKVFSTWFREPVMILSDQPEEWQTIAIDWLVLNVFPCPRICFTSNKLEILTVEDILIEDHPHLIDYSQVLLIDRSYNRKIELPHRRIYTPQQLFDILLERSYDKRK